MSRTVGCVVVALLGGVASAQADGAPGEASRDRLALASSLRLRSELEAFADRDTRLRWRIRARAGATYRLEHGLRVGMRLATGSDDPTSAQLTLGGTFDKRPLRLDRAYFNYRPGAWLSLWAGKVPIPFRNRRLIWDRDLQPEGLSETIEYELCGTDLKLWVALGQYVLAERAEGGDPAVLVAQAGLGGGRGSLRWSVNGAHYRYLHSTDSVLDYDHGANSRTPEGLLNFDYHILDLLAEGSGQVASMAVTAYAEGAYNVAVDAGGRALAVGLEIDGEAVRLRAGYEYRRVERDAILDNLAESSWYRQRTDFQGHKLWLSHAISSELAIRTSGKAMRALSVPRNRQLEWLVDLKWVL